MKNSDKQKKKKSIFHAIFVPVIIIMLCQSMVFYITAVYGGVEQSLDKNAADILSERLINRKNEIETEFTMNWANISATGDAISSLYGTYDDNTDGAPFDSEEAQVNFLYDSFNSLVSILRTNGVNGAFLILNDKTADEFQSSVGTDQSIYGLSIRDLDQTSSYIDKEDLLLERCPSVLIKKTGCTLDSWWESRYTFGAKYDGRFYYEPLIAAYENPGADSDDIAFFCDAHRYSETAQDVVSYSIPLTDKNGNPFAVLGVELTTKFLATLLPNYELSDVDTNCYVLAMHEKDTDTYIPIVSNGAFYNRCFVSGDTISAAEKASASSDGFVTLGRGNTKLYGQSANLDIYANNNPFEKNELTLVALVDYQTLFQYSQHVKLTLLWVSVVSLIFGVVGILTVSARFASPIKALARRARNVEKKVDVPNLGHVGISEIDQLVDSIESLNRNVSKEIARTEFFSRMSHDMRTPMNAIISFSSQELLEDAGSSQKDDYLEKIHSSGIYLLGLINEVLDMTKIESNKVDLRNEPMPADSVLDTVVPMVQELAQQKNVCFKPDIAENPGTSVLADKQHICQIVMNLLSNAVKFTPAGGTVALEARLASGGGKAGILNYYITVSDTGRGMSREFLNKLYTPFEQETTGYGGTGLGLSISKKLVDLMGGSINCTSKKGEGTTFSVMLPLEKYIPESGEASLSAGSGTAASSAADTASDDETLRGKHILICEDHPMNMQIALRLLQRKGMSVDTAVNGKEGVEKFTSSENGYFDAVLMDIRMPEMDGLQASAAIRALDRSDAKSVPIIAMTANAFEEDVQKSRAAGMNAHLSKPIEPDKLYRTMARLIR